MHFALICIAFAADGGFRYRDKHDFGGFLHWDMNELQLRNADLEDPDLQKGQKLATQGQLLLDDVSEDGGGFCCIPGFHRYVDQWVAMFPPDVPLPKQPDLDDPRVQALRPQGFQLKNIPGKAGDLLIWHRCVVTPIPLAARL